MSNNFKKILFMSVLLILFSLICSRQILATECSSVWDCITDEDNGGLEEIGETVFTGGTPKKTIPQIIASIVNYLLGVLGIIFITLVIYGGFVYMTAMGDSDKISNAKSIIISASIGVAIILASYSFTYFIVQNLTQATTGIN